MPSLITHIAPAPLDLMIITDFWVIDKGYKKGKKVSNDFWDSNGDINTKDYKSCWTEEDAESLWDDIEDVQHVTRGCKLFKAPHLETITMLEKDHPFCNFLKHEPVVDEEEPYVNPFPCQVVVNMMTKMDYFPGMGLGMKNQGISEPIVLVGTKKRFGLGYEPASKKVAKDDLFKYQLPLEPSMNGLWVKEGETVPYYGFNGPWWDKINMKWHGLNNGWGDEFSPKENAVEEAWAINLYKEQWEALGVFKEVKVNCEVESDQVEEEEEIDWADNLESLRKLWDETDMGIGVMIVG